MRRWCTVPLVLGVLFAVGGCATIEEEEAGLPELRTLWDFGDPAATEARFRGAAERGRSAGDESYALEADTQAARTLGMRKRFDEAHALLDTVEAALEGRPPAVRVRYLLERGRTLRSSGSPGDAVPLFREAYGIAGPAGLEGLQLDAAHMLAIVEEPDAALEWAYRAVAVAEATEDSRLRAWLGPLYNNTGWTHHERGEFDGALDLWWKSVEFRRGYPESPEPLRIAWRTYATGLRSVGRHEEGFEILARIHGEDPEANEADGYWQEEMAEHLLLLGRSGEARPYFARAHALLSGDAWLVENERSRLRRLAREGGVVER